MIFLIFILHNITYHIIGNKRLFLYLIYVIRPDLFKT